MRRLGLLILFALVLPELRAAEPESALEVAFGEADITPESLEEPPVWLAGYAMNRRATGVHDALYARCILLRHEAQTFALVSLDLIGLQYPAVQRIRAQLVDYTHITVSSTHNHEGPDVIGVWGKSPVHRGVDDRYVDRVISRTVAAVREAEKRFTRATASYGTAEDETLLHDSREPYVKDGVLRTVRFNDPLSGRVVGLLVQWNCHPETLGSRNTLITADYPAATIAALRERWECPVVFFCGALGGLMAPPPERIRNDQGQILGSGDFEFARHYGIAVAELADRALANAQPICLSPLRASARTIMVPVDNPAYRLARVLGVLRRQGRIWTGNFDQPGELVTAETADARTGVETEVAYLRCGELHVACIPGEIYPELVYGKVQDPPDPGADFPDAPPEPAVVKILPGPKWLLLGLANDELGYLIPQRQWDNRPPYAYGRGTWQYGEINSCGPEVAPIIMQALTNRVREAEQGLPRP